MIQVIHVIQAMQVMQVMQLMQLMQAKWGKVWSRLAAHLQTFFRLLARTLTIFDKKIPYFDVLRQKRVLFSHALTGPLCGSN